MAELDQRRLMIKVARLYHTHGIRQADIASRLQISQSRVSRLLTQAVEAGIVRTVVSIPQHINAALEEQIESLYGLNEVHVIDAVSDDEAEINRDLAHSMADLLPEVAFEARVIGFTSWSSTLRQMVDALEATRTRAEYVVEMLGDIGAPDLQHDAARSTQRFAELTGGQPVFLRTPGVVASGALKELLLSQDAHARQALEMLNSTDLAFMGVGAAEIDAALRSGDNFFTNEQYQSMRDRGAVGEICLHFVDADGKPITPGLDDRVIGVSVEQLRKAHRRWAVAGGPRKHAAVRAAAAGKWIDSLVTDTATAEYLIAHPPTS